MKAQTQRILDKLEDKQWHCTSEFYADYMPDARRRLCDLRDKGFNLENRKCQQHNYHRGLSKQWKLVDVTPLTTHPLFT